jgi:hypothetical protein
MRTPMLARCLILTGTIVPNAAFTLHSHASQRRDEYIKAITYYSNILEDPIYFLENSTYEFASDVEFQRLFQEKNIKLIKYPVSSEYQRGKGYQEFQMMDDFVREISKLYNSFIKVSGRYLYRNIKALTNYACRGLVIDLYKQQRVAVTSLFYTTILAYEHLIMGLYLEVNDSQEQYIEKLLYRNIMLSESTQRQSELFPITPELIVTTGSTNTYIDTTRNKLKLVLRNTERMILRKLNIPELF